MMYICIIYSNNSHAREYSVNTKSAMKCAEMFGRCEFGEVVTVRRKCGTVISQARYTPEDGGKYYRCDV